MPVRLTKFQFFEDGYAQLAVELGLMSPSHFQKYIHFKLYMGFREEGHKKLNAIQLTAEKTLASKTSVWRSVAFFTS